MIFCLQMDRSYFEFLSVLFCNLVWHFVRQVALVTNVGQWLWSELLAFDKVNHPKMKRILVGTGAQGWNRCSLIRWCLTLISVRTCATLSAKRQEVSRSFVKSDKTSPGSWLSVALRAMTLHAPNIMYSGRAREICIRLLLYGFRQL